MIGKCSAYPGGLTASDAYVMLLHMTAHIYGRGQMVIPAKARKEARIGQGDVVLVQPEGNGRIVLTRLEKPQTRRAKKAKITFRKGTHAVASTGRKITSAEVRSALEDFP